MESNCVFCDRKQFEERLIAKIDRFYIIATLGQITDGGYVLLFPEEHISCAGALSREYTSAVLNLAKRICGALTQEYDLKQVRDSLYPVTVFEHGIVGQTVKHAHWHFLPVALDLTPRIERDFPSLCVGQLKFAAHLQELYKEKSQPYLYWGSGMDSRSGDRVLWNPPAPPQYLRIVTAEALGRPQRANWRQMDPELDKKLWSETVWRLKPYFSDNFS